MIWPILKKSLVLVLILGILLPSIDGVAFAMDAGPEGASDAAAAAAAATGADAIVGPMAAMVINCVPATMGVIVLAEGEINPIVSPFVGVCMQLESIAAAAAAEKTAKAGAASVTWLQRLANFAAKIAYVLLKKVILDKLVAALINWINHDGKGGIIENWDQFFADAEQNAIGESLG